MLPPSFRQHTVTLEVLAGQGRYGPTFNPPLNIAGCWVEPRVQIITSSSGEEISSTTTVWLDPTAPVISPGDRITSPAGRVGYAISVATFDSPGMLAHTEVAVT